MKETDYLQHAEQCGTAIPELALEPETLSQTGREECKR